VRATGNAKSVKVKKPHAARLNFFPKENHMKYFMVESTFKKPLPVLKSELERLIKEHTDYLQEGFDEGWILVSGPKATSDGGIIVLRGSSIEAIENYFQKDPMKVAGVQEYRIIEFKLHDSQPELALWFGRS
jgi:uncharacterized protein YciI